MPVGRPPTCESPAVAEPTKPNPDRAGAFSILGKSATPAGKRSDEGPAQGRRVISRIGLALNPTAGFQCDSIAQRVIRSSRAIHYQLITPASLNYVLTAVNSYAGDPKFYIECLRQQYNGFTVMRKQSLSGIDTKGLELVEQMLRLLPYA